MPNSDSNPTEVTDEFWIYVNCKTDICPAHTLRGGKWMVFVPLANLDATWRQIKKATEEGKLGSQSKSSTALVNPNATDENKAIMVFTYDGDDEQDVWRVRNELRNLGITWKLYWKPDEATRNGLYTKTGHPRSWRYSG